MQELLEPTENDPIDLKASMKLMPRRIKASGPAQVIEKLKEDRARKVTELETVKGEQDRESPRKNNEGAEEEEEKDPVDAKQEEIDEIDQQLSQQREKYSELFGTFSSEPLSVMKWMDDLFTASEKGATAFTPSCKPRLALLARGAKSSPPSANHAFTPAEKLLSSFASRFAKEKERDLDVDIRVRPAGMSSSDIPEGYIESDSSLLGTALENMDRSEAPLVVIEWPDPSDSRGFLTAAREVLNGGRARAVGAAGIDPEAIRDVCFSGVSLGAYEMPGIPAWLCSQEGEQAIAFCKERGIEARASDAFCCGLVATSEFERMCASEEDARLPESEPDEGIESAQRKDCLRQFGGYEGLYRYLNSLQSIAERDGATLEAVHLAFLRRLGVTPMVVARVTEKGTTFPNFAFWSSLQLSEDDVSSIRSNLQ